MQSTPVVDIVSIAGRFDVGITARSVRLGSRCRLAGLFHPSVDFLSTLVQQFFPIEFRRNARRQNELRDFVGSHSVCP